MLMTEEMKNTIVEIIGQVGLFLSTDEVKEVDVYEDQDGRNHLILKSSPSNEEQLDEVYSSTFLTGNTCAVRSELVNSKNLKNVRDENNKELLISTITVASVIQKAAYSLSDMKLMSYLLAWVYKN